MRLKDLPDAAKWKAEAENTTFFGEPVKDMDRDSLLLLIGFLREEERRVLFRPIPPETTDNASPDRP